MIANTTALHAMCGALPVSPEDAAGLQARALELKQRLAMPVCDSVSLSGETSSNTLPYETAGVDMVTNRPAGPLEAIADLMRCEPEYAWAWHCNFAMPIMDEIHCTHEQANRAAARIMSTLFDVDVTTTDNWASFPWARSEQLSRDLIEAARDARGG